MKQLKKTLLTLVALLALTTQAWATDVYLVGNGTGNWLNGVAWDPGAAGNKMTEQNGVYSITFTNVAANSELQFKFAINGTWDENYGCTSDTENELNKTLSNIEVFGTNIMFGLTEPADVTISFNPSEMTYMISTKGMKVGDDAPSGPEVAWDKDKKTGTFTMPGGNVTLEPEYYPQATVADAGVTAADADARATTDDPLVKVDATKLTGAKKLMYFVSNSGTTAPAYDAEGWTDQLPTAEGFTQQGIVYVWYYPVGTDEGVDGATATYSDGDICLQSITARIAPEPTYAVEFAEGTEESDKWSAEPNANVKKGQTVTVTYTGSKKVIGVKAEKKAAVTYPLLSAATTSDYGKVVCAAGHLHDAKTAVPDGCTAVGILGKVTTTGHGLILALQDAAQQDWNTINGWTSASYAGTTLKQLPAGALGSLTSYTTLGESTVSNWCVAQKSDYDAIFTNLGSTAGDSYGMIYDGNVNAFITGAGGAALSGDYWSVTESEDHFDAWHCLMSNYWSTNDKREGNNVRPVLGF